MALPLTIYIQHFQLDRFVSQSYSAVTNQSGSFYVVCRHLEVPHSGICTTSKISCCLLDQ